MADILIIVGTEGGNARFAAEAAGEALSSKGHTIELTFGNDSIANALDRSRPLLVCTSTYGYGDLPENLAPFVRRLGVLRPDLRGLPYGVIALGDRTYTETFCMAGRRVDALLAELGGRRLGPRLEIDTCADPLPDTAAQAWAENWASLLDAEQQRMHLCGGKDDAPRAF
ncbi:flavodoxin domain-containing protein [Azospirillum sp. TSO22-1]|uniref:flavodoxin domain-containing protein n=1 Tax=Azospirillum sp. TSO22-1 TaxID=716789 RepID=UPI000D60B4ED|nr:flavodoxin domain-containing protein [Azospirillum sp. TSO22-1]PWC45908.1 hypothetical protein TSO221_15260 [Azospirillum sp. TSO22-1]